MKVAQKRGLFLLYLKDKKQEMINFRSNAFIYGEEIMFLQRSHTPNIELLFLVKTCGLHAMFTVFMLERAVVVRCMFHWKKSNNYYWFALFAWWQVQNTGHRSLFYHCKK